MTRNGIGSNQYVVRSGGTRPEDLHRVSVSEIAAAFTGDLAGFAAWNATPDEVGVWHAAGRSPLDAAWWVAHHSTVTAEVASDLDRRWGIAVDKYQWVAFSGVDPDRMAAWIDLGVDPGTAAAWPTWTAEEASKWLDRGFVSAAELEWWQRRTGMTDPTTVKEAAWRDVHNELVRRRHVWWDDRTSDGRRAGLVDPDQFLVWDDVCGDGVEEPELWLSPDLAGRAAAHGLNPTQTKETLRFLADPSTAESCGMDPDYSAGIDVVGWWATRVGRCDDVGVARFKALWAGTHEDPTRWIGLGFDDPASVHEWAPVVNGVHGTSGWVQDGELVAAQWRDHGFGPAEAAEWMATFRVLDRPVHVREVVSPIGILIASRGGTPNDLRGLLSSGRVKGL